MPADPGLRNWMEKREREGECGSLGGTFLKTFDEMLADAGELDETSRDEKELGGSSGDKEKLCRTSGDKEELGGTSGGGNSQ